jgi:hypothetical protein
LLRHGYKGKTQMQIPADLANPEAFKKFQEAQG